MRKIFFALFLLLATGLHAQRQEFAAGFRGGLSSGLTFQQFYSQNEDMKLLLSFREGGVQLSGLMEIYKPVMISYKDQFFMYYGAGVHVGYTRYHHNRWRDDNQYGTYYHPRTKAVIGADGIIGIEYRIEQIPITVGFDYKPFFELFGQQFFRLSLSDFAFTIKYNF